MNDPIVQEIALELIDPCDNIRQEVDADGDLGLAGSIAETGILSPVVGQAANGRVRLIAGNRRFEGAKKAGLKTIPVRIIAQPLSEAEVLKLQLTENLQRQDLNPVDQARAVELYITKSQLTASEAAKQLGLTNAAISNLRSILRLPKHILDRVGTREIPISVANELSRVGDRDTQNALSAEILQGKLTRDGLAGRIKAARRQNSTESAKGNGVSRATALLGMGRAITISGRGLSLETLIEWLEELLGKARKVRPQGVGLNTFMKLLKDQAQNATGGQP